MGKRVIVAGTRTFTDFNRVAQVLDQHIHPDDIIVTGDARGVDEMAQRYARMKGIFCRVFHAKWDVYGRAAGPIRNMKMAEYGTHLIAFWDGKSRGTKSMIYEAQKKGLEIHIEWI